MLVEFGHMQMRALIQCPVVLCWVLATAAAVTVCVYCPIESSAEEEYGGRKKAKNNETLIIITHNVFWLLAMSIAAGWHAK